MSLPATRMNKVIPWEAGLRSWMLESGSWICEVGDWKLVIKLLVSIFFI
ncbi:MAG: hypothetical protein UX31_C0042G0010 [Candidatus Nomurabacteria bacterium GW2011_GWA1_46_11]|uniref:Uncharacterized protein n=1 Tax=Candidatus Nomurabacteria bacterium GW2011_GWA1_46_11 TaxID=1618732 RepID=A0A0G1NIF4_9BACT|nr:MAG: hypothetical protein UX31_C0042G0010 [Candidatus Nomurabacteria bacterium GW2011_GWA1_46_11]